MALRGGRWALEMDGVWYHRQWASDGSVEERWDLELSDRRMVPQPVIDAFEAEGFIWGGNRLFFVNMHFEYRPESIIMARNQARRDAPSSR
ncbi:MAG: M15 family metallopeptidase [Spirochaetota bacterium]